jgi:hypothetical protein
MGLTLHLEELVLSSKLVEDLYVYFCISDQVFSLDGRTLVDYICTNFFFSFGLHPYRSGDRPTHPTQLFQEGGHAVEAQNR